VFQVPPADTADAVRSVRRRLPAHRHAQGYNNEAGVGAAIKDSGLPRDEVFVTTKLNNQGHGYDSAIAGRNGA